MRDVRDEYFRKMYIRACEVANNSTEDPKVREVASAYCEMRSSLVRELKKLDAIEEEKSGLEKRIASLEEAIDEQDREIHRLHIEQEFLSIKQLIEFSDDFEEIMCHPVGAHHFTRSR